LLSAGACPAEDWEREIRALRPADTRAQESTVLDELQDRAKQALDAIPHARTRGEADRARPMLRQRLEQSLGFRRFSWPPDLQARVVGTIQRNGYHIEKIVYQTLPGTPVAAHLYVPAGLSGRAPAILFYNGHWWPDAKTRPDFQAFCINMARLGFMVLTFDPFGQGERGISTRDHRRVESLLVGVAQQGIAEYESQCALQYLLSRKEVDPQRIGMTGASGGGYNTWITSALDDRIKVAVPVVGTSDFYEQIAVTRPLDWYHASEHCHFVPGLIRYANNHEFAAMVAPRPLMIIAASQDQSFPIEGVREVFRYGRGLYTAFGAPDQIGFFEDTSAGHGYQQKKREAAYGWFLRWLMGRGDGSPYREPATETEAYDAPELRCFEKNEPAGPGIIEAVRQLAGKAEPAPSQPLRVLAPPAPITLLRSLRLQRVLIPSGRITLPAFYLAAPRETGVLVAVDDRGKEELASDPVIREAAARGWSICGVDPRGVGESATTQKGWVAATSLLLNENFVLQQGEDMARVCRGFPGKHVSLYAHGENAALAAAYAIAVAPDLAWYVLRDGFLSFRQFLDRPQSLPASFQLKREDKDRNTPYDREIPFSYVPLDGLRRPDISQMLASASARCMIVNPVDGDWRSMPAGAAQKLVRCPVVSSDGYEDRIRSFLNSF
jgi:dienelactone hydrolase